MHGSLAMAQACHLVKVRRGVCRSCLIALLLFLTERLPHGVPMPSPRHLTRSRLVMECAGVGWCYVCYNMNSHAVLMPTACGTDPGAQALVNTQRAHTHHDALDLFMATHHQVPLSLSAKHVCSAPHTGPPAAGQHCGPPAAWEGTPIFKSRIHLVQNMFALPPLTGPSAVDQHTVGLRQPGMHAPHPSALQHISIFPNLEPPIAADVKYPNSHGLELSSQSGAVPLIVDATFGSDIRTSFYFTITAISCPACKCIEDWLWPALITN
eukprot:1139318-Pelagomonas_calceolata.AAC.4